MQGPSIAPERKGRLTFVSMFSVPPPQKYDRSQTYVKPMFKDYDDDEDYDDYDKEFKPETKFDFSVWTANQIDPASQSAQTLRDLREVAEKWREIKKEDDKTADDYVMKDYQAEFEADLKAKITDYSQIHIVHSRTADCELRDRGFHEDNLWKLDPSVWGRYQGESEVGKVMMTAQLADGLTIEDVD